MRALALRSSIDFPRRRTASWNCASASMVTASGSGNAATSQTTRGSVRPVEQPAETGAQALDVRGQDGSLHDDDQRIRPPGSGVPAVRARRGNIGGGSSDADTLDPFRCPGRRPAGARKLIGSRIRGRTWHDLGAGTFLRPDVEADQLAPTSPMSGGPPGARTTRRNDMKYMLLIYGNEELWESFPPEDLGQVIKETDALHRTLPASGELIGAYGVADQAMAKTVRLERRRTGRHRRSVHRGQGVPRAASTSSTARAEERALEIAALVPFARHRHGRGAAAHARGRAGRVTHRRTRRGPAARARAAGPRRARPPLRPLRRVRGRGAGGAARGGDAVAGRRPARQPAGVADHRRVAPAHRRAAQRRGAAAARGRRPRRWLASDELAAAGAPTTTQLDADDTLTLLFLCCHPALSPASQLALTLRAVGGLTTAEIARAFLVPEATMAQRISRAKQTHPGGGQRVRACRPSHERADAAARWCCTCST